MIPGDVTNKADCHKSKALRNICLCVSGGIVSFAKLTILQVRSYGDNKQEKIRND